MKIGIISDTHDNLVMIQKAVELFNKEGVKMVLHAGDHVSPFTAMMWEKLDAEFMGIFGNNDGDHVNLEKAFKKIGKLYQRPKEFIINGKKILVMHEPDNLAEIASSGKFDIIIHGHTHRRKLYTEGKTLIINPGEGCGWLTGNATAAILDLETKEAREVEIGKSPLGALIPI